VLGENGNGVRVIACNILTVEFRITSNLAS